MTFHFWGCVGEGIQDSDQPTTSVFISGLQFPGRPGFPAVLIPGLLGIKTPSFPGKTGTSKRQLFIK